MSFLIIKVKFYLLYIHYLIVWPVLVSTYFLLILSNIENFLLNNPMSDQRKKIYSHFGLRKFEFDSTYVWNFLLMHFTIILFCVYSRILTGYLQVKESFSEYENLEGRKYLSESLVRKEVNIQFFILMLVIFQHRISSR